MKRSELATPALVGDADVIDRNLQAMAKELPGRRLRPHVKAHKCTGLAKKQAAQGHPGFTCATIREVEGMAAAGLGEDLLLANEVLDARRLGALDARVTVAVDSEQTIRAAAAGGVREVLIDVNVGLPRCGCAPDQAGRLADLARSSGLEVRGVMGYEGHVMPIDDTQKRDEATAAAMQLLVDAHDRVGGDVLSAGGTTNYALNRVATEIQAGSYVLMDRSYAFGDLPFQAAVWIESTVISVGEKHAVSDAGLKSIALDHGNPEIDGAKVWFVSDEHVTFAPESKVEVGDRVRIWARHVDPTVAKHERLHLVRGDDVVETLEIDLRGW